MTMTVCIKKKNYHANFCVMTFAFFKQHENEATQHLRYYDFLICIHGRFGIILQCYDFADTSFIFYRLGQKK